MKTLNQCLTEVRNLNIKLLAGTESEAECHYAIAVVHTVLLTSSQKGKNKIKCSERRNKKTEVEEASGKSYKDDQVHGCLTKLSTKLLDVVRKREKWGA